MNWLQKSSSMMRHSVSLLNNRASDVDPALGLPTSRSLYQIDSRAALDSFKTHWTQAWEIMRKKTIAPGSPNEPLDPTHVITADDITTIINNIDQMVKLLIQESQGMTTGHQLVVSTEDSSSTDPSSMVSPLLDYLLMESMLDKLLIWASDVGEFTNRMKLQQLKLYQLLVEQLCHQTALFTRPLVRPMFHLLVTCSDCAPVEVEKKLVSLLNTLARCLCQNVDLLDLFFVSEALTKSQCDSSYLSANGNDKNQSTKSYLSPSLSSAESSSSPVLRAKIAVLKDRPEARFLIFSLLIPFVHREGTVGSEARDALLKIMTLSRQFDSIGRYVANESNFCPVLATGLSGLYSSLPRKIRYEYHEGWCTLTPEDVKEMPEVQQFLTSLKFCDAVIEEAHPLIQKQLLEYVYQGFLESVIGPALLQDASSVPVHELETSAKLTNSLEEMIATTAYLELFLRQVTQPQLLQVFLRLICLDSFDGEHILTVLISRINGCSKLSVVTLVLFRRMIDLCCEDVMLELIFKYLIRGQYLGGHRKRQVKRIDDVERFDLTAEKFISLMPVTPIGRSTVVSPSTRQTLESLDSFASSLSGESASIYSSMCPIVLDNYMEYLCEARYNIHDLKLRTNFWSRRYDSSCLVEFSPSGATSSPIETFTVESPSGSDNTCTDSGVFLQANNHNNANHQPVHLNNGEQSSPSGSPGANIEGISSPTNQVPAIDVSSNNALPSPNSTLPSSVDVHSSHTIFLNENNSEPNQEDTQQTERKIEHDSSPIGPFLSALLTKLEQMSSNDVFTNLQLTGILSRLTCSSHPLLRSFLLNTDLPLSPGCPSLLTSLTRAKEDIEKRCRTVDHLEEHIERARSFFTSRDELFSHPDFMRYVQDHYSMPTEEVKTHDSKPSSGRRKSLRDFLFRGRSPISSMKSPHQESPQSLPPVLEVEAGKYVRYRNRSNCEDEKEEERKRREEEANRIASSLLLFSEFIKELSAIAQEHFIFAELT